jgi:hypothetical protein
MFDIFLKLGFVYMYFEYWLWICVYNLLQHIKNDSDSTDVVENDYRGVSKMAPNLLWVLKNRSLVR